MRAPVILMAAIIIALAASPVLAGGANQYLLQWGEFGTGPGDFNVPRFVACSTDGFVYVTDMNNNRVQRFDDMGNFQLAWGSIGADPGKFSFPHGVGRGFQNQYLVRK